MAKLCVNIDHVATIRQARRTVEPDPVAAAVICETAGARGITIHLREDRRHIQDRDLQILRQVVRTKLNLEMAATQEMVKVALLVKPDQVTLVPERREEITTEGGLDAALYRQQLQKYAGLFREAGISLSLFIDADPDQVQAAHFIGAQYVELCTGPYSLARGDSDRKARYESLLNAAKMARKLGMRVNAGHGLTYENVRPIAAMEGIEELNIGHSIISRAVLVGMDRAVQDMAEIIRNAHIDSD